MQIKYLNKQDVLVNIAGPGKFPKEHPVFWLTTNEQLAQIKRMLLKATEFGFDPDHRMICATIDCEEGLSIRKFFDISVQLEEISKEHYNILKDIPCWNPVETFYDILKTFLDRENERDQEDVLKILQKIGLEEKLEGKFVYERK